MNRYILLGYVCAILCYCTGQSLYGQSASEVNLQTVPPKADSTYVRFSQAYQDLDVSIMKSLYSKDALYMESRGPIKSGQEEIAEGFEHLFDWAKGKEIQLNISFRFVKREVSEGQVTDIGYYLLKRIDREEKEAASAGKFIVIQKLHPDGNWRISLDSYNPAPATAYYETPE